MSWDDWLPATRGDLRSLWSYALGQTEWITKLGERMARMDDLAARLNAATDELARDLQALRDEVAGVDEGLAARFEPLVTRLEGMGQDPENPVPDAGEGAPAGGDTGAGTDGPLEVTNPTPGASDNPNG